MMDVKMVLCPVDFSTLSEKELRLAAQICERFDARMMVQHNIDDVPPIFLANAWMYSETHMYPEEEREAQASRLLKAAFEKLPKSIKYEGRITFGKLDECILHLAKELPADLIVMGTHDPSSAEHTSYTDRVLTQSPCPVLTMREIGSATVFPDFKSGDASALQPVVLPMDFSIHSLHALEYALRLMDMLPMRLHLLHIESPLVLDDFRAVAHSLHFEAQKRQRIAASLERLKALVPTQYLSRVRFEVRMGTVVDEIIAYAQNVRATLIVMGAHAKNALDRMMFGANSQGVLHRSPCPVWLVPQKAGHSNPRVTAAASQA
jgi:nucleotide-binding universal stress UspA family protein